jgi:hypothetical protein
MVVFSFPPETWRSLSEVLPQFQDVTVVKSRYPPEMLKNKPSEQSNHGNPRKLS